jgi:phytoene desaturase
LLSIIGHLELNIGSFFPKGGMVSITQRLADTARSLGVHFILDAEVERILTSSGKVTGVAVDGQHYAAKVVVSNVDVHYTYKHLLPDVIKPSKILNQEMSSSAVVFYWGVESKNDSLGVHNILFSNNYRKEFEAIFKTKTLYEDPTIYIHISSKAEPSDAPSGCENWFVMVNAPINIGQDWDAMVNILREQVIQKINRNLNIDLSRLIATEFINNPVKLSQTYNGESGSIYGNSSNSTMAAFYRHPNHAPSVKGLYFAGVTVHPGGGIPLALNGAKIIERMVREDFNKRTI